MYHYALRARAHFLAMHPLVAPGAVLPVHWRWWVLPGLESLIALVACVLVATAIAAGSRPRWALLPAAMPMSLLLVLAAAVIATLRLPLAVRVPVLLIVPFADPSLSAAYVLGVPALKRQFQVRNKAGSASNAPTSAMT
jgi:hypothetical protein